MTLRIFVIALVAVSAGLVASSPLVAKQSEAKEPERVAAPPVALTARSVGRIEMTRRDTWTPRDPEKNTGALVVIRFGQGAFATEEFALSYKVGEKLEKAVCRGYSTGGGWAITDEEGRGFQLFTGNPVTDIDFLFEIPKGVAEVTLLYKGNPTGGPVPVKGE